MALLAVPLALALAWLGLKEMTSMAESATLSRTIPPMDAAAPKGVQTATFASG